MVRCEVAWVVWKSKSSGVVDHVGLSGAFAVFSHLAHAVRSVFNVQLVVSWACHKVLYIVLSVCGGHGYGAELPRGVCCARDGGRAGFVK